MKFEGAEESWYNIFWFSPDVLSEYSWMHPYFLYFAPIIPLVFFVSWLLQLRFRKKLELAFVPSEFSSLKNSFIRHCPNVLFSTSLLLILLSLARPQIIEKEVNSISEGIDLLLLLDISESMELQDLKPNRLESAISFAKTFLEKRSNDRVGLVVFSSSAISLSPLTHDKDAIYSWLDEVSTKLLESTGTAIGNAIATGINRLRDSENPSKAMVIISDGENTAGKFDPETAAKLASAFNIKIYTIAIGKEGRVPFRDPDTREIIYVDSHLDVKTLESVADITSGKFFRASNSQHLENVFEEINTLEKGKIQISDSIKSYDFYHIYLKWALLYFIFWLFTKSTFLTNALED